MKINKLYDDVYEINNFLTDEEMFEVNKIIKILQKINGLMKK
jgi:hypothetical protein